MRINSILKESEANGPGKRGVVWVQGCSRHCKGCFNPETQSYSGGIEMDCESIMAEFDLIIIKLFLIVLIISLYLLINKFFRFV